MDQKHPSKQLQEQWERAVERAVEEQISPSTLDVQALDEVAGLRVKAGVKGGWNSFGSCGSCGTCQKNC